VLGWPGHEQQWGHDAGTRAEDVRAMYTAPDPERLDRYDVRYVVVGPLERTEYGDAGIAEWDRLGRRVYDADGTIVWDLAQAP
jgi:uncharacterized membrane protein